MERIEQYYHNEAVSQSQLKLYRGSYPYDNKNTEDEEALYFVQKKPFMKGDAVDTLLSFDKETFDKYYTVSTLDKLPSEKLVSITHEVRDLVLAGEGRNDSILESYKNHNYQTRWGDVKKIEGWKKDCKDYYDHLVEAGGKTVLSKQEEKDINLATTSLHANFGNIFDKCEAQSPIYWEMEGVNCKALRDFVDTENRIIYDLKTTSFPLDQLRSNINKFGYRIQESWYTIGTEIATDQEWQFKFIFVSFTAPEYPVIVNLDNKHWGMYGREPIIIDGVEVKKATLGWVDLLKRWKHYNVSSSPYGYEQEITL